MSTKLHIFLSGAALLALATACDNIDENNRYLELPAPPGGDDPEMVVRNVLMEEFTGQRCVNCPAGHEIIEKLEEQYGDRFICVSIHGGTFAIQQGIPNVIGLGTAEGDAIVSRYDVTQFPKAVIDGTSGQLDMDSWSAVVYNRLKTEPVTSIALDPAYDAATGVITVSAAVGNLTDAAGAGQLHLWVVENGIEGAIQLGSDGKPIAGYVHNNVFRAWFHGIDGLPYTIEAGGETTATATVTCSPDWNPDNLYIVAFTRSADNAVGNALRVKLIPAADDDDEEADAPAGE